MRTTYRIASTTSRRGCFSGRPPVLAGGGRGSIRAHWSSVKSGGRSGAGAWWPCSRPEGSSVSEVPGPLPLLKHALSWPLRRVTSLTE